MAKTSVILSRIDVKKLDLGKNAIELSLVYKLNEAQQSIDKKFNLGDSIISFSVELIKNIKDSIKTGSPGAIIAFGIKEDGEIAEQEKLTRGITKLLDSIERLKRTSESDKYMKLFYSINNSKIAL